MMKILLVVDVQKDFIDGTLGSNDAQKVLPDIQKYINQCRKMGYTIIFTQDSHKPRDKRDTLTLEETLIPKHCIDTSEGSAIMVPIAAAEDIIVKSDFMMDIIDAKEIRDIIEEHKNIEIEIIGFCTDICVISNALLFRKLCPHTHITIIENLCAGTSKEAHKAALTVAKSCLINVKEVDKINLNGV